MKHKREYVVTFAAMATSFLFGCSNIESEIRDLGYTPVQPPTNLTPAGSVARIVSYSPLKLRLACSLNTLPGANPPIEISDTLSKEAERKLSGNLDLSGDFVKRVKASINAKGLRSITTKLTNLKVMVLPSAEAKKLARTADTVCSGEIQSLFEDNWRVTMIDEVLQGDAVYEVNYDSSASATAEATITAQIAAKLGGSFAVIGDRRIQGTGLIWGIKEDKCNLINLYPSLKESCIRKPSLWERMFGWTGMGQKSFIEPTEPVEVVPILPAGETVQVIQSTP